MCIVGVYLREGETLWLITTEGSVPQSEMIVKTFISTVCATVPCIRVIQHGIHGQEQRDTVYHATHSLSRHIRITLSSRPFRKCTSTTYTLRSEQKIEGCSFTARPSTHRLFWSTVTGETLSLSQRGVSYHTPTAMSNIKCFVFRARYSCLSASTVYREHSICQTILKL
jgi:hypothetical protein